MTHAEQRAYLLGYGFRSVSHDGYVLQPPWQGSTISHTDAWAAIQWMEEIVRKAVARERRESAEREVAS